MTVQDTAVFVDYVGDGAQTSFPFTFRTDDVSHLSVDFTDDFDQFLLNADQDNNPGGSVEYTVAPPTGQNFQVIRDTPDTQELDYTRYDPFDSESHEDALDKLTMLIQELSNRVNGFTSDNILAIGTVDNSILRWNLAGQSWDEFTAYILPLIDGTVGQVMVTDGVGGMTFEDQFGAVSTQADSVLRGDGTGGYVEETDLTIDSFGNLTLFDNEIRRPTFVDYAVKAAQFTISANSVTIDLEVANACYIEIEDATGDFNVILNNPPAFDNYGEIHIDFVQGSGGHNAIWPSSVQWPGGTAPVLSTGNFNRDTIHLWTRDAGITWFGSFLQDYGSGTALAELDNTFPSIPSAVLAGGPRPIASYRMNNDGKSEQASGDTSALLVYQQMGNDWLISGLNCQFECEWIQTSTSGAAATLIVLGTSLSTFTPLSTTQTLTWSKDTNSFGVSVWNGTVEIREIANPGNTTGQVSIQLFVEASL